MHWLGLLVLIAAGAYLLHRVALVAEERGWIRYTKGGTAGVGNVMQELDVILQPQRPTLEVIEREQDRAERACEDDGDPLEPHPRPAGATPQPTPRPTPRPTPEH
jgi:hypothetical protein